MVYRYLKRHLPSIIAATTFSVILGVVSAAVYSLVGPALKVLMTPDPNATLSGEELVGSQGAYVLEQLTGLISFQAGDLWQLLPLVILVLAALRATLGMSSWFIWERVGELVSKEMRSDLMQAFVAADPKAKDHGKDENFSAVLTNDVRMMREYLVHFYGGLPREALQAFCYALTLFLLSPRLFVIFVFAIFPALYLISRLGKKLKKRAAQALDDYSLLTEWLQQRLMGIETIKHYGTEVVEHAKMRVLSDKLFKILVRTARVKARTSPILESMAVLAMAIILFVSLREVGKGDATGSVQLSFFSTLAVLSQSLAKMGRYFNSSKEGHAAIERIKAMHDDFLDSGVPTLLKPAGGQLNGAVLNLTDVSVRYGEGLSPALRDLSLQFAKGRIYCLAGPSGAGKSTLFRAVLGLVPLEAGEVKVCSPGRGGGIGYIPQDVQLFSGSVAENIAYPSGDVDRARVSQALEEVGLRSFVESLPQGVDTLVGDGGKGLSGGQMQRLLLARIFYHEFPIVLMDEGTSALDPESERLIHDALERLAKRGVMIIMIAHRMSSILRADEVVVIDSGAVTFRGTVEEARRLPLFNSSAEVL